MQMWWLTAAGASERGQTTNCADFSTRDTIKKTNKRCIDSTWHCFFITLSFQLFSWEWIREWTIRYICEWVKQETLAAIYCRDFFTALSARRFFAGATNVKMESAKTGRKLCFEELYIWNSIFFKKRQNLSLGL